MSLNSWTEVLVRAENVKDMTYSFAFKNQYGQDVWGTKVRPLPGARNFLSGISLKKNVDELKIQVAKGKGAVAVLVFLGTIVAAVFGYFNIR